MAIGNQQHPASTVDVLRHILHSSGVKPTKAMTGALATFDAAAGDRPHPDEQLLAGAFNATPETVEQLVRQVATARVEWREAEKPHDGAPSARHAVLEVLAGRCRIAFRDMADKIEAALASEFNTTATELADTVPALPASLDAAKLTSATAAEVAAWSTAAGLCERLTVLVKQRDQLDPAIGVVPTRDPALTAARWCAYTDPAAIDHINSTPVDGKFGRWVGLARIDGVTLRWNRAADAQAQVDAIRAGIEQHDAARREAAAAEGRAQVAALRKGRVRRVRPVGAEIVAGDSSGGLPL